MSETLKTGAFLAGALALAIAAAVVQPERRVASVFSDEGEAFYPKFRDAQTVKAIEVVDYDESTATARPLKVELRKGRWVIASNNDYPIDIGDRLVKTSAALIDLKKDQVRSEQVQDHARYGVVDPLDQKVSSLQGRGKRVTLRDAGKNMVADFILGKPVEGKAGWRYLRVPGQKRTYAVKTDADPSARFADWVNADLLRVPAAQIRRVSILNYNASQLMSGGGQMENVVLLQEGGNWKSGSGETVKTDAVRAMANTLDRLKIVDARPKPPEMARDLREGKMQLSLEVALSLRQNGYMLMQNGRILASEGEMSVELANGALYHLRFGDVAASADAARASRGDNRYLFVTASWDTARASKYGDSSGAGERVARDLNLKFADWFYVIGGADFQKIRLKKTDVVR
jgi:hypothetical protein